MYYLALIITQVLFGLNFPISKSIVTSVDPLSWACVRFLVSGLVLFLVTLVFRWKKRPQDFKDFLLFVLPIGVLGILCGQGFMMVGLRHTGASNGAIIMGTIPILAIIINYIKTSQPLSAKRLVGVALAFSGTLMITLKSSVVMSPFSLIGDLLVLMGAVSVASYFSLGKFLVKRFDHFWVTSFMLMASGLVLLPYFFWKAAPVLQAAKSLYPQMLFSIFGATLLTYFLSNISLKKISANTVSLFIYLQPIVASVVAVFYLNEDFNFVKGAAFFLIFLGVIFCLEKRQEWEDDREPPHSS